MRDATTTSASLAGVMPWASRTSSLRGTFMSTSIRATSCDGMRHRFRRDLRIDVIAGDERVDHVEVAGADAVHRVDAARA